MTEDRKMIKAIAKLNWLTQDKMIVWEKVESPDFKDELESSYHVYYKVFGTEFEGKNIGLIVEEYIGGEGPTMNYRLGVFDDKWCLEWEFPKTSAIRDLYNSIMYEKRNISDFLDRLVKSDPLRS